MIPFLSSVNTSLFISELIYWANRPIFPPSYIETRLNRLADRFSGLVIFSGSGSEVSILRECNVENHSNKYRMGVYHQFFNEVLRIAPSSFQFPFGFFLDDSDFPEQEFPVFTFQRQTNSRNLLLPDVDMFIYDWYQALEYADPIPFEEKSTSAVFVGSTTGAEGDQIGGIVNRTISEDYLVNGRVPRIESARFFANKPEVFFDLPVIVQCEDPYVESLIKSFGFGHGRRTPINDQLAHKFMLSMDGNGAACSRVAIALKSNSALVKYKSNSELLYFRKLVPWEHYIPVEKNEDILRLLAIERTWPGTFKHIADQGAQFFLQNINRDAQVAYTAALFHAYGALVNGALHL